MEPMLKGSQELSKSKLIKSSKVNSDQIVFCRCVICFCFLLFVLFFFVCLCFLCHQRVGLRFSVIPPQFERTLLKAMLAMAAINLPLYDFPCSFYTREPEDIVVLLYRQLFQL